MLLAERPPEALTVDAVVEAAGVAKGIVHRVNIGHGRGGSCGHHRYPPAVNPRLPGWALA